MAPISDARKRANKKWNDANMSKLYDRVNFIMPKGMKEKIQTAASKTGESVSAYILRAVTAQMEKETNDK